MANLLNRETLLKREELKIEKLEFENGDYVYIREMTGRERDNFEQSLIREDKKGGYEKTLNDFRAKLAVNVLCDESGKLLLNHGDYPVLSSSMSAAHLDKIVAIAQRLNAISQEDKEELIKNSGGDQVANSNLDSAEN